MELSWIDIGIVIILLLSIGVAIFRGFVKEAISLAGWIIAIWLAIKFAPQVALFLPQSIDQATINIDPQEVEASKLRIIIAGVLIIVGTLIASSLLNYILSQITQHQVLRGADRMLGALFGFFRGAAIVVILILAASATSFPKTDIWNKSQFLPPFILVARVVISYMPDNISKYFSLDQEEAEAIAFMDWKGK